MKVVTESQDGGTSHFTLIPEPSDLAQPSAEFQAFVRDLNCEPLTTAVSAGQFQRQLEQAFADEQGGTAAGHVG